MKKSLQKIFSTGEFAKLLDIKKDTLLYYDKIDLFKPAGIHPNGYRFYKFEQFDRFVAIQSLRSVQFPIKELKTYFESPTLHSLQHLAVEQTEKVELEIKKLQDIQFFLRRVVELTKEMEGISFGKLILKKLSEESIVYSEEEIDWAMPMEELYHRSSNFLKALGVKSTAAYGVVISKEQFLKGDFNGLSYLFCRLDDVNARKKPAGLYAIIYHKGPYELIHETYTLLMDALDKQQLVIDGDLYEEYLLHSIGFLEEDDYVTKISVKVKK